MQIRLSVILGRDLRAPVLCSFGPSLVSEENVEAEMTPAGSTLTSTWRDTMGISYSKWDGDTWIQVEDGVVRRNLPKRNGTARSWHENGELAEKYELVDGVAVGERREWHDNGVLAKTEPFVSGRVHGTVRQWNREGNLLGEYTMTDGRGVQREWNEDGTISMETEIFSEGTLRVKVFDDLGKAIESFMWNGKQISKKKFRERI